MSPKISAVAAAILALATSLPRAASADDASVERADALFQEGRAAVREGDWERGCPKFEESLRLDPAPGTRINLGECEERSGHLVAAFELYERASRELAENDPRLPLARQRAQAVDARIPRLVVPSSAHVRVDGAKEILTGDLRLDPGRHSVVVIAGGAERTTVIALVERERRTIDTTAPASAEAQAPAGSAQKVVGLAVGGVGIAAVAAGLVFGGLVLHDKSVVDAGCDASDACTQEGLDAKSEGRAFATVSTVAIGAGLAALAAGIFLVVSSPRTAPRRSGAGVIDVRF